MVLLTRGVQTGDWRLLTGGLQTGDWRLLMVFL